MLWHQGLIYKLYKSGIRGILLQWLSDYLKDRGQRVIVNGEFYSWGKIKAEIPQGSVLEPLLFLLYINDLTEEINYCNIR